MQPAARRSVLDLDGRPEPHVWIELPGAPERVGGIVHDWRADQRHGSKLAAFVSDQDGPGSGGWGRSIRHGAVDIFWDVDAVRRDDGLDDRIDVFGSNPGAGVERSGIFVCKARFRGRTPVRLTMPERGWERDDLLGRDVGDGHVRGAVYGVLDDDAAIQHDNRVRADRPHRGTISTFGLHAPAAKT